MGINRNVNTSRNSSGSVACPGFGSLSWSQVLQGEIKEFIMGLTSSPWIFTTKAHPVLILEFSCPCQDLHGVTGLIQVAGDALN